MVGRAAARLAGRTVAGAALALLCGTAMPAHAVCAPPGLSLAAGAEHSRWRELDAQGRPLLHEQGTLATLSLALDLACAGIDWRLAVEQAAGRRAYDGRSTTGAALATHSRIARTTLELTAWVPLADTWAAGVRLGARQLERDIAGAGAVSGYAERFRDGQLAAGLRQIRGLGPGLRGTAELWLGAGPAGRLALQLPQADAAVLRLGSSRLLQAALALHGGGPDIDSTGWGLQLSYRREHFGAGPAQPLMRQGLRVGGATQPQTQQSALALQATLGW